MRWKATSVTAALDSLFIIFMRRNYMGKDIRKIWATIRPDFTEHFIIKFFIKAEKIQAEVLNSTCRTISVYGLLHIVNFYGWTFLKAFNLENNLIG